jgi:hypothetical protein
VGGESILRMTFRGMLKSSYIEAFNSSLT